MKKINNIIRSQKGMTLIELLAVVVILAILALIAIPSIGGLIDNTKKDAHVANAHQMVSSARLAMATEPALANNVDIELKYLIDGNYIENVEDPDKTTGYNLTESKVYITNGKITAVRLINDKRGVQKAGTGDPVEVAKLDRKSVN